MDTSIVQGLLIAMCWGSADIQCDLARLSALKLSVLAQGGGMLFLVAFGMLSQAAQPSPSPGLGFASISHIGISMLLGLGIVGALSYFCMYRAFQSKDTSTGLVSTIIATNSALTVLLATGLLHEYNLHTLFFIGIILSGVILVAYQSHQQTSAIQVPFHVAHGLLWAIGATISLGVFNFGVGVLAQQADWYWLLFGVRALSLLFLAVILAAKVEVHHQKSAQWRKRDLLFAAGSGMFEIAGVILLSIAVQHTGTISTLSAIASCSVLLPFSYSLFFKKETIHFSQIIGVLLIMLGLISFSLKLDVLLICIAACSCHGVLSLQLLFKRDLTAMHTWLLSAYTRLSVVSVFQQAQQGSPLYWTRDGDDDIPPVATRWSFPSQKPAFKKPKISKAFLLPISILVCLLITSSFLFLILLQPTQVASSHQSLPPVGIVSFANSGQLNAQSSTGVNDTVRIEIHDVSPPHRGKAYYAWLLPDAEYSEEQVLFLGKITLQGNRITHLFTHPEHKNMLALYSRFQITEQDVDVTPLSPSPNQENWRYQGTIPNITKPGDPLHYSYLDHLRHLLAEDPMMKRNGLAGGLNIWLYRNSAKIMEWAHAARDNWNASRTSTDQVRRQIIRILDYLDGANSVWRDVPPGTPFLADAKAGHFGLIDVVPHQNPSGYLTHVIHHVRGLLDSPSCPPDLVKQAERLSSAINTTSSHLQKVREEARHLVTMKDEELKHTASLIRLNTLVSHAESAFLGDSDPSTGLMTGGISWVFSQIHYLGHIPVMFLSHHPTR